MLIENDNAVQLQNTCITFNFFQFSKIKSKMGSTWLFVLPITFFSLTLCSANSNDSYSDVNQLNFNYTQENVISTHESLTNNIQQQECELPSALIHEINGYQSTVQRIIDASTRGFFKGRTWRTLAKFVDKFGSRIAGSENLEHSIDYMVDLLKKNKLENVHTEPAMVPKYIFLSVLIFYTQLLIIKISTGGYEEMSPHG